MALDRTYMYILVDLLPAIRSLERRARYSFTVYMFVFCTFFVNDFSTTRGPIHAKFCMRAYSGSGCLLPYWGLVAPRGAENGGNEIFVTIGVNGEFFCILVHGF